MTEGKKEEASIHQVLTPMVKDLPPKALTTPHTCTSRLRLSGYGMVSTVLLPP